MIHHTGLTVSDMNKAKAFYEAALKPLGLTTKLDVPGKVVGFGEQHAEFYVSKGEPRRAHTAFVGTSKKAIDDFYSGGTGAGGTDNGAPGYRKNKGPGHYAAFVHDQCLQKTS